jgi:subtilisin family serine protease
MQPSTTSARSAARPVRPARFQAGLDLVGLTPLMEVTTGTSEVAIGLIDGPVATNHPDLPAQAVRGIGPSRAVACNHGASVACAHGTYVAGILIARRNSPAPAICPDCVLLVRPIFLDVTTGRHLYESEKRTQACLRSLGRVRERMRLKRIPRLTKPLRSMAGTCWCANDALVTPEALSL